MTNSEKIEKLEIDYWAGISDDSILEESRRYNEYFKKDFHTIPKVLVPSVYDVGRYISVGDRTRVLLESFSKSRPICINSGERIIDRKRESENKIYCVYEAAIKTYPTAKLIEFIGRWIDDNLPDELKNLTYKDVGLSSDTRLVDDIYVPNEEVDISPLVQVLIPYYDNQTTGFERLVRKFSNDMYLYGYFYSSMEVMAVQKQPLQGKKIVVYSVMFEAKYTEIDVKFDEKIYHVIPTKSLEKVRRGGLAPRYNSKEFEYPERIYFFNNAPKDTIVGYGITRSPGGFCILSIDSDRLKSDPLFKSGKMKFYADPLFTPDDTDDVIDSVALFTYSNVRPGLIDDDVVEYVPVVENPRRKEDFRVVHRNFR